MKSLRELGVWMLLFGFSCLTLLAIGVIVYKAVVVGIHSPMTLVVIVPFFLMGAGAVAYVVGGIQEDGKDKF